MSKGVRRTASIKGHPIHPMLVPFPIAFLVGHDRRNPAHCDYHCADVPWQRYKTVIDVGRVISWDKWRALWRSRHLGSADPRLSTGSSSHLTTLAHLARRRVIGGPDFGYAARAT